MKLLMKIEYSKTNLIARREDASFVDSFNDFLELSATLVNPPETYLFDDTALIYKFEAEVCDGQAKVDIDLELTARDKNSLDKTVRIILKLFPQFRNSE